MDGKYQNCNVSIYSVTYCLYDEKGNEVRNDDGTLKLFKDFNGVVDTTTWAEWVEADDLEEMNEVRDEDTA